MKQLKRLDCVIAPYAGVVGSIPFEKEQKFGTAKTDLKKVECVKQNAAEN